MTAATSGPVPFPDAALDQDAFRVPAGDEPAGIVVHRRHAPLDVNEASARSRGYEVADVPAMPRIAPGRARIEGRCC